METKEEILENLRKDCNRYSAQELQRFLDNGILDWNDLLTIYRDWQLRAIYEWKPQLEYPNDRVNMSQRGIEIYVWGDHGVGKTCFIGAICSVLRAGGMFIPQGAYGIQLSHMFWKDVCTLPMATLNNIQVAEFQMVKEKRNTKKHGNTNNMYVYIIEMPSKIGMAMYKAQNGISLTDEEHYLLEQTKSYLENPRNLKIHYFLMEYENEDENNRRDDSKEISQEKYLSSIVDFLNNERLFRHTGIVEVCGLVTKCDRIDEDKASSIVKTFPPSDRPLHAYEYARRSFDSFWRSITDICKNEKIPTICISYSIGKVFAQNLCEFNPSDTAKVIEHLQSLFNRNFFTRLKEKLGLTKRPQRPDYI